MRSEKLIQLDRPVPPSRDTREEAHRELADQVAAYLAGGGTIDTVTHTDNHSHDQPIKRNRKDQIQYMKAYNKIMV